MSTVKAVASAIKAGVKAPMSKASICKATGALAHPLTGPALEGALRVGTRAHGTAHKLRDG